MTGIDFERLPIPEAIRSDPRALTSWLYEKCYLWEFGSPRATCDEPADLAGELSRANTSRDITDHGWQVVELLQDGALLARKRGFVRRFEPGEYVAADRGPGSRPEKGDAAAIFVRRGSLLTQQGMYFAFGETVAALDEDRGLLRFYWNVLPAHAPALVERITLALNSFEVPFRFKCPADSGSYPRRDAAVLYVLKGYSSVALPLIARVASEAVLESSVPLFTRELVPGLGFAEDPNNGESFGMHRCRLVAEALIAGEPVSDRFAREGIAFERPWLNNANSKDMEWPAGTMPPGPRSTRGGFLDTAARIGARLCGSAIWHAGMCNWTADTIEGEEVVHAALDSDLYSGSSGISWFLSRLAGATGERIFSDTAMGALRHAISRPVERNGLYLGRTGVGFVTASIEPCVCEEGDYDLLSGAAGQIVGLLSTGDRGVLLHRAVEHGDWLIANRDPLTHGWVLSGLGVALTGFSHGAAGIGWALAELWGATGERRFADAARDAFRFERRLFDPDEGGWPDLREPDETVYPSMWCHGAAGIALSRLRALSLLEEDRDELASDLELALHRTERSLQFEGNWCLCHGNCGNADILLSAGRREIAVRVGQEGIERFEKRGVAWPGGIEGADEQPGLMLGLAGIGYFYLRLHDAAIPSILQIR